MTPAEKPLREALLDEARKIVPPTSMCLVPEKGPLHTRGCPSCQDVERVARALQSRDERIEELEKLLREVRMYALGSDCSSVGVIGRVDAALAPKEEQ